MRFDYVEYVKSKSLKQLKALNAYGDGGYPRNAPDKPIYAKTRILKPCYAVLAEIILLYFLIVGCGESIDNNDFRQFTFTVADVGQGLAQFGVMDGRAVVWDVGPANGYGGWRGAYNKIGMPHIEMIVISHSDEDHYGGLRHIEAGIDWNGVLAVSPFEDTAKIRNGAGVWSPYIKFKLIVAGDTLNILDGVEIICLWPPRDAEVELPLDGVMRNRYSLVFSVRHNNNRALITSDIDSIAMRSIAVRERDGLRAQILSVPHHGSSGSVNDLFFAYVSAETAVFSCAQKNSYGHPSAAMIDMLGMTGAYLMYTYIDGTVSFTSNGYYWQ